ncbi:hypothetical protein WJX79_008706 [Trebouxia sp. C0005]
MRGQFCPCNSKPPDLTILQVLEDKSVGFKRHEAAAGPFASMDTTMLTGLNIRMFSAIKKAQQQQQQQQHQGHPQIAAVDKTARKYEPVEEKITLAGCVDMLLWHIWRCVDMYDQGPKLAVHGKVEYLLCYACAGLQFQMCAMRLGTPGAFRPQNSGELKKSIRCILHALKVLHQAGYAHTDLRWESIVVQHAEQWVLIDLEFACVVNTVPFTPVGHTRKMRPELYTQPWSTSCDFMLFGDLIEACHVVKFTSCKHMAACLEAQHPCGSKLFDPRSPQPVRDTTLLGSKRGRCSQQADLPGSKPQKICVWQGSPTLPGCSTIDFDSRQFVASNTKLASNASDHQAPQTGMASQTAPSVGMERSLSEVSSLRAAATAAVAECTGGLGVVGASALSKQPKPSAGSDDTHSVSRSGRSETGLQSGQSLGSVTRNTQKLSIQGEQSTADEPIHDLSGHHQTAGYALDALQACPPHGAKAICGRRPKMEDAYTAIPFLLEVPVPADQFCTLHQRIAEALSAVSSPAAQDKIRESFAKSQNETAAKLGTTPGIHPSVQQHLSGSFSDAKLQPLADPKPLKEGKLEEADSDDDSAVNEVLQEERRASQDAPERKGARSVPQTDKPTQAQQDDSDAPCSADAFQSALTNAFTKADEEFGKADNAALVGTTAVVALVGSRQLYVANCGDSRAVLSRGDVAIPLTDDHKAAREDETARVEAAGGQILFWNGVRVMGVLAVSRAIGDHCLRPFVIAQPEITILARKPDDELLLLASDGLWDVLTNQEACSLAKRCLRRARQRGATRQSAARIAATVLTRAAVDRGSRDNVTVVVVDLMSGPESEDLSRQPSSLVEGFENFDDNGSDGGFPGKSPRISETSESAA